MRSRCDRGPSEIIQIRRIEPVGQRQAAVDHDVGAGDVARGSAQYASLLRPTGSRQLLHDVKPDLSNAPSNHSQRISRRI